MFFVEEEKESKLTQTKSKWNYQQNIEWNLES